MKRRSDMALITISIVSTIVLSAAIGFSVGKVSGLVKGFRKGARAGVASVLNVIFSALKKEPGLTVAEVYGWMADKSDKTLLEYIEDCKEKGFPEK